MSTKTRKRRLNQSDDESDASHVSEPPLKKVKISVPELFECEEDQEVFEMVYHAIESSELIRHLNVPSPLCQQIAFNTIGWEEICANKQCKSRIILPPYEYENEKSDDDFFRRIDNEDFIEEGYFCADCFIKLRRCDMCNLWKMDCKREKCSGCDAQIDPCPYVTCAEWEYNYECAECDGYMCSRGACHEYCEDCGNFICTQCFIPSAVRSLRRSGYGYCDECDDCLFLNHPHCTVAGEYARGRMWELCGHSTCQDVVCARHEDAYQEVNCKNCDQKSSVLFCEKHRNDHEMWHCFGCDSDQTFESNGDRSGTN